MVARLPLAALARRRTPQPGPSRAFAPQISLFNIPVKTIQAAIGPSVSQELFDLTTSLLPVGGMIGALFLAPWLVNLVGRRAFLLFSSPLFMVGGGLMMVCWWITDSSPAASLSVLVIGRFLCGVGVGGASVVSPMYVSEISPVRFRGAFGSMVQFGVTAGILVVQAIGVALRDQWVWIFAISVGLGVLQALLALVIARSPAFVATRGSRADAVGIVQALHNVSRAEADMVVDGLSSGAAADGEPAPSVWALVRSPVYRFPLLVCVLLQVAQQVSGINAVFFFSAGFFKSAGVDDVTGSLVAAGVNIVATALAVAVVECLGRRALLLASTAGMMFFAAALTVALVMLQSAGTDEGLAIFSIVCVAFYVLFFELGLGPIPWMIGAEIFPERPRATAMSVAAAANWIFTFVVAQSFPAMQKALTAYSFVPFAGCLAALLIFFVLFLPETKDRLPEDVLAGMGIDVRQDPDLVADESLIKRPAFDDVAAASPADVAPSMRADDAESGGAGSGLYFGGS